MECLNLNDLAVQMEAVDCIDGLVVGELVVEHIPDDLQVVHIGFGQAVVVVEVDSDLVELYRSVFSHILYVITTNAVLQRVELLSVSILFYCTQGDILRG